MTYEEAVSAYYERVGRLIRRRVRDASLAADLTQEVWLRAWRGWASFDGRYPWAWLKVIASNVIVDHWREQAREPRSEQMGALLDLANREGGDAGGRAEHDVGALLAAIADDGGFARYEEIEDHNERVGILQQVAGGLYPNERRMLAAYLEHGEIGPAAASLGVSYTAVRAALFRARGELRRAVRRSQVEERKEEDALGALLLLLPLADELAA